MTRKHKYKGYAVISGKKYQYLYGVFPFSQEGKLSALRHASKLTRRESKVVKSKTKKRTFFVKPI